MSTITLHIPNEQVGWFEQMIQSMGWTFHREETTASKTASSDNVITPALRRRINKARREYANGETITCRTPQEMQQFFDSL